jgi:hypothetical protein
MIHEHPTVSLFLVSRICGEEYDFCEAAMNKWSIANASDHFVTPLDDSERFRIIVINKSSNIVSRNLRELLLEKGLQTSENY